MHVVVDGRFINDTWRIVINELCICVRIKQGPSGWMYDTLVIYEACAYVYDEYDALNE